MYAFVTRRNGANYLTVALAVYPFEEPGIGPNKYSFDDEVLYQIHVATGDDLTVGRQTFSYRFRFTTEYRNSNTILQSYLGVVENVGVHVARRQGSAGDLGAAGDWFRKAEAIEQMLLPSEQDVLERALGSLREQALNSEGHKSTEVAQQERMQ